MFPVIYLLGDDNEATGFTLRFCSAACRSRFRADPDYAADLEEPTADGDEPADRLDANETCRQCGAPLTQPERRKP